MCVIKQISLIGGTGGGGGGGYGGPWVARGRRADDRTVRGLHPEAPYAIFALLPKSCYALEKGTKPPLFSHGTHRARVAVGPETSGQTRRAGIARHWGGGTGAAKCLGRCGEGRWAQAECQLRVERKLVARHGGGGGGERRPFAPRRRPLSPAAGPTRLPPAPPSHVPISPPV